jgi:ribonucleoside-diphosphate reductase alpha chain
MKGDGLDHVKLQKTIRTAMRMLDNVIDINYYAVDKARNSNLRHRPVGMGIMGHQDCLHMMRVPFASDKAVKFADRSMEAVCYYAYLASTELAEERGRYESYTGSLWDRGILPQDSIKLLAEERGGYLEQDTRRIDGLDLVRNRIKQFGMRNSNCVAIAPTATISNIIGVSACIEPTFQNLYVKSNLSGEFTEINGYLVRDLKARDLWDEVMIADLKYFDGSLSKIDRVPQDLRDIYATAFEVEPKWLVEQASRRQKWIDQAQSLNIYMAGASGKKLDETYKLAWLRGLKTTYYLRTIAATHMEKSTSRTGALNAVSVSGGLSGACCGGAGPGSGSCGKRLRWRTARPATCVRATPVSMNAKLASKLIKPLKCTPGLRGPDAAEPKYIRRKPSCCHGTMNKPARARRRAAAPERVDAAWSPSASTPTTSASSTARPTSTSWCRSSTSGPGTSTWPAAPTTGCRRK